jgi:hypothetical protein
MSTVRASIAAQPPDRVGGPYRQFERPHDPAQQLVAGGVSVAVVDQLEAIDVEQQHRALAGMAAAAAISASGLPVPPSASVTSTISVKSRIVQPKKNASRKRL